MDRAQLYVQNILTKHTQNKHGSHCRHMDTWQQNNSSNRQQNSKYLETETSRSLVCMLVLVTTEIKKINGIHLYKHSKFYYQIQTWQKTEHGINRITKASLRARFTHHKALHDKTSIPTARRHVNKAIHGKSKFIACMDQLQQPWQN